MPKVQQWTIEECSKQLQKRFEEASMYRKQFEPQWEVNAITVGTDLGRPVSQLAGVFSDDPESSDEGVPSDIGMNYAFKYLMFLHSQLSANPPSVMVRPASSDPKDRRKADAADRLARWHARDKDMQEVVDQQSLKALIYGNGWLKQIHNPDLGDIFDFNEETSEVTMEGDIELYSPDTEDVWVDPDAKRWKDVRYTFERVTLPLEEAIFRFPDNKDEIKSHVAKKATDNKLLQTDKERIGGDRVEIYEYYEKALPVNGMAGRHAFMLHDGTILGKPGKNPHFQAGIPLHLLTYVDVPNQVYGKSVIEYVAKMQEMLTRLDSSVLDNIQAHGMVRMVLDENADVEDESVTNSAWDWIKVRGGAKDIKYLDPAQLMPDIWRFRDAIVIGIQEMFGINDSMMGIQQREQSAVSQQTAIEAGTMIHRRLFKKYSMMVEAIYKDALGLIKENWDEPRTILVLGKEKAFLSMEIKGADIAGGYDLVAEYGTSLPLDPNMRRETILLMKDFLIQAGLSERQILKMMKLNDLEGLYDRNEMAGDRQREIFEEMIARYEKKAETVYIAPEEMQDHVGRLEYAYDFLESAEFKYLDEELQEHIKTHVKEREQLAAQAAAPGAPGAVGAAGAMAPPPDQTIAGMPGVGGAVAPEIPQPSPALAAV